MYTSASRKLNDPTPTFYPVAESVAALNEAQRLFCLLTLVLEKTAVWSMPAATAFFHLLSVFADMIVPLRIMDATGAKIRPVRLDDLAALDSQWPAVAGAPKRYARLGADLLAIYPQPTAATIIQVTYARSPATLAADTDVPEIPVEYHPELVNYAINRLRQVEGAEQLARTMPLLNSYLDAAQACGAYVEAKNRGGQMDVTPFELQSYDRSQLLDVRKDLVPLQALNK